MTKKNNPVDVFKFIDIQAVDKCWPWKGRVNRKDGRPYLTIEGKKRPAYIIALELFTGEEARGREALHSCDTENCCNPHHLRFGTHQQNMNDMVERERHGLPRIVVRAIKTLLQEGNQTQNDIAKLYGVSRETITAIHVGRSHKGVGPKGD